MSCRFVASGDECSRQVDSLNRLSYELRYRNIAQSQAYAQEACRLSAHNQDGHAEALNHLAYVRYQQMDFDGAERLVRKVQASTNNQIELLVADVMGMKICQRTSANHDFFVYRNRAQRRLNRISGEEGNLSEHLQGRLLFARTEFHIVSATYYFYLDQKARACAEINRVEPDAGGRRDTAQWLYLNYMKGSGGLCEEVDEATVRRHEFDCLFRCYTLSKAAGYLYFEGNCLQAFATLLADSVARGRLKVERRGAYDYLYGQHLAWMPAAESGEDDLPIALATHGLHLFQAYKDWFQTGCVYRTLGELMLYRKEYATALGYFKKALAYANKHHRRYYPKEASGMLYAYRASDTVSVEMQWMQQADVKTVPEWIAGIREQMSVAYSALGDKQKSDYNRNIYLDLLELTRQDKELESRYEELVADTRSLSFGLAAVVLLILLLAVLFLWLSFRWQQYDKVRNARLRALLDYCRSLLSAEEGDEKEVAFYQDKTWSGVVQPYRDFACSNRSRLQEIGNERLQMQEDWRQSELRIAVNKRNNIEKRAKMALALGIVPFLDRVINEVRRMKLSEAENAYRLHYIEELVAQIEDYNAILTQWIRLQQGQLSLHIENFELRPLFDLLSKSRSAFEHKGIELRVEETDAAVKADRALTLFMINTLVENARKFTPSGGTVTLSAQETDAYVEVAVADTGCGLSDEDIALIGSSKVYDAGQIGQDNQVAVANKGSGFGLMNCKGIIEKYRKTSALFGVCMFGIESRLGQGSRFYFRLPCSLRKGLACGLTSLILLLTACGGGAVSVERSGLPSETDTTVWAHPDMQRALRFTDSLYFANIEGGYSRALCYADSACRYINRFQQERYGAGLPEMTLAAADGNEVPAEVEWWNQKTATDYNLLLAIRNETAVAALALNDWRLYRYNNHAYRQLYKLLSEDSSLETYCREMEKAQTNKRVSLALILLLSGVAVFAFYLFYFRKRLLFRFNLSQVMEINRSLLAVAGKSVTAEETDGAIGDLLGCIRQGLSEVHALSGVGLLLYSEEGILMGYFTDGEVISGASESREWLVRTYRSGESVTEPGRHRYTFPLGVEQTGVPSLRIGAILFDTGGEEIDETDLLIDELVVRYLSMLLYQSVVRRQAEFEDLELAANERSRALYEEGRMHVQNMVLDNCLSAIKHESMYYPSRIRQLVERLFATPPGTETYRRQMDTLAELAHYYKEVYTILCAQANRQLTETRFRRKAVSVDGLLEYAERFFGKRCRKAGLPFVLEIAAVRKGLKALGDEDLLRLLLENLITAALQEPEHAAEPVFRLLADTEGRFVRFRFFDSRPVSPGFEPDECFTPAVEHIPYLLCKQIIREHDNFTNHCGCRIQAEALLAGGFCIWFTIPQALKTN